MHSIGKWLVWGEVIDVLRLQKELYESAVFVQPSLGVAKVRSTFTVLHYTPCEGPRIPLGLGFG